MSSVDLWDILLFMHRIKDPQILGYKEPQILGFKDPEIL